MLITNTAIDDENELVYWNHWLSTFSKMSLRHWPLRWAPLW